MISGYLYFLFQLGNCSGFVWAFLTFLRYAWVEIFSELYAPSCMFFGYFIGCHVIIYCVEDKFIKCMFRHGFLIYWIITVKVYRDPPSVVELVDMSLAGDGQLIRTHKIGWIPSALMLLFTLLGVFLEDVLNRYVHLSCQETWHHIKI